MKPAAMPWKRTGLSGTSLLSPSSATPLSISAGMAFSLPALWLHRCTHLKRFREGTVDGCCSATMFAYSVLEWRGNIMFPAPYMGVALVFLGILGIGRWSLKTTRFKQQTLQR
ncbi:MAG: hypothetical protein R3C11_13025 [Planctomycetaceae bacterium]